MDIMYPVGHKNNQNGTGLCWNLVTICITPNLRYIIDIHTDKGRIFYIKNAPRNLK